jgi:hypothetical protein
LVEKEVVFFTNNHEIFDILTSLIPEGFFQSVTGFHFKA